MTSILLISPVFLGFKCAVNAFSTFLLNDFGALIEKSAEVVNDYKSDFVRTILYKMCMQY